MSNYVSKITRSGKFFGLLGLMLALASIFVGAPAASASSVASADDGITYGKLSLIAVDSAGNSDLRIAGATVVVQEQSGESIAKGVTNDKGSFSSYVEQGVYKVRVTAKGYYDFAREIKISPEQTTSVTATLTRSRSAGAESAESRAQTGVLKVSVENVTLWGAFVQAKVEVYTATGTAIVARGLTDGSGNYTVKLPEGDYRIVVRAEGFDPAREDAMIAAGKTTEVKVTLQSTSSDGVAR